MQYENTSFWDNDFNIVFFLKNTYLTVSWKLEFIKEKCFRNKWEILTILKELWVSLSIGLRQGALEMFSLWNENK